MGTLLRQFIYIYIHIHVYSPLRARYFEAVVAVEEEGLVEKEAVCAYSIAQRCARSCSAAAARL